MDDMRIEHVWLGKSVPVTAQRILHGQEIDEDQPGTILRDFTALVEFIGQDGLKTTGKYCFLPQGRLDELNERMSRPVAHALKRPQQRSFPHLQGLFLILRASGLGIGQGKPSSRRLTIDPELRASWCELNPTERYFALLESWLIQGSPEIIAERAHISNSCYMSLIWVVQKLQHCQTLASTDHRHGELLYGVMQSMTVALMELFGWVRLEYERPAAGEGAKIRAIERLPLGDAMVATLIACESADLFWHGDGEQSPQFGALQPLFQPYFPEWQRTLVPSSPPYREGTHVWRVSLGRVWRRIVSPHDSSLDQLAMTILDAFEFDRDHLYCFVLRDPSGRELRIACPYETDAAACTEDVCLGELPLSEGEAMKFIFDYGDNWEFTVQLESVESRKSTLRRPKVTHRSGDPPAQYGSGQWD